MTAEKHLHEKLGISFAELGALLGFRNMLAAGLVTTCPEGDYNAAQRGEHVFNMEHPGAIIGCGSIGCIAGGMAMIMRVPSPRQYTDQFSEGAERGNEPIAKLFYPKGERVVGWRWITPGMAVKAIDNFINYVDPRWGTIERE